MGRLIHVASILDAHDHRKNLYLRELSESEYRWFDDGNPTEVAANSVREALRVAARHWHLDSFETLDCGYRFTLPERDEHGEHALFWQMVQSYLSLDGVYFDESVGHQCIVTWASKEALDLWHQLQEEGDH